MDSIITPCAVVGDQILQVWSLDSSIARKLSEAEAEALYKRFADSIAITPTDHASNMAIYATKPEAVKPLADWMREFAPLASYRMMTPQALSN